MKEIVDQVLEGDGLTIKHPIWPEMVGHAIVPNHLNILLWGGKGRSRRITRPKESLKKSKNNVASMQTKGKEEEDNPFGLEVGEKNSKAFLSRSEGMLLAQDKGKRL